MTDVPADVPVPGQPITENVKCTRCGYNLSGLTPDKLCPECATPIARSVHGNLLRYADPDWLNKLRFGAALMLWNLLISVCLAVSGAVVAAVGLPPAFVSLLSLVGGALGLWAAFLITTPEPALALTEDPVTLRKVVRTCAILNFVGSALQQAGTTRSGGMMTGVVLQQSGTLGGADVIVVVAGGVLLLVGVVS